MHVPDNRLPAWHWATAICVALARFVHLGFRDLQAWDEALYAVRAESVVRFGAWLDQTPYAIDGLYSSLHPPLYVWLTALVFHVLGTGEFQARFVSAAAGAATVPIIMLLGKQLQGPPVGLLAAVVYGLNPFTLFFSRQGQFDSLLVFFLALSAYHAIRMIDEKSRRSALVAGVALGAALMTKLFVAIGLPVAILAERFLRRRLDREFGMNFLTMIITASALALPWHVYMTLQHSPGNLLFLFEQSALWDRTLTGIEGNVKPLEFLYYVNQLIVLFPIGIWWFVFGLRKDVCTASTASGLLFSWFAVFFVVLSLMRTKLAVYLLPILVPCSLLAAHVLWNHVNGEYVRRHWFILLSLTGLSLIWSADQSWRNAVKDVLAWLSSGGSMPEGIMKPILWLVLCSLGSILLFVALTSFRAFAQFRMHIVFLFLLGLAIISLYNVGVRDRTRFKDGATEFGQFMAEYDVHRIVVAGVGRNPQLTYYLRGADIGWRDDLGVRRITPPQDTLAYSAWLAEEMSGEQPSTLLVVEKDRFLRYRTVHPHLFVPPFLRPILESRRYSVFVNASANYHAQTLP
jgi:hypothetical protein